jgi:hypothetical protein
MAGEKLYMPTGSRTLLVRWLLFVNLQADQTGNATRSLEQGTSAARARSIETDVQKFGMVWAVFDMFSASKLRKQTCTYYHTSTHNTIGILKATVLVCSRKILGIPPAHCFLGQSLG